MLHLSKGEICLSDFRIRPSQSFVTSFLHSTFILKDGRLKVNDQLLCINDTSLIGLSNSDAMSVLRLSMEKSLQKGSILIIIGRSSKSLSGFVSRGISPLRGQTPPRAHSPIERKVSNPERRYESPTLSEIDSPKIVSNSGNVIIVFCWFVWLSLFFVVFLAWSSQNIFICYSLCESFVAAVSLLSVLKSKSHI